MKFLLTLAVVAAVAADVEAIVIPDTASASVSTTKRKGCGRRAHTDSASPAYSTVPTAYSQSMVSSSSSSRRALSLSHTPLRVTLLPRRSRPLSRQSRRPVARLVRNQAQRLLLPYLTPRNRPVRQLSPPLRLPQRSLLRSLHPHPLPSLHRVSPLARLL